MKGLGVHTSLWAMEWTRQGAETSVAEAKRYGVDFIEIALLDPPAVDTAHTRALLETAEMTAVCSLGLPESAYASRDPEKAVEFLSLAVDKTVEIGGLALSGVTYGGIGERTGVPPTQAEVDNVARALEGAAKYARTKGIDLGIEPVNRYENHIINTGRQAAEMIAKVGADNIFIHLDTYHTNIEEHGVANGILAAREHLRYMHMSESHRGVPGSGTCDWNEICGTLAAIGFDGGLALESFINLPPQIASALSVWRPVADSADQVMQEGLPFLRNMARQYGLV
ncbi:sugar phosphate isomerase/epimerase [Pelagibius sp.]|uniref:sugar phosphate isomerase/epimerase family protein n=1 Tax=Pelagibius sp. TaxID=1931238 RepID=UPI002631033C|nr:sugar phosphate isomerase/epimerase [Pelagibius sp.]